MTPMCEHCGERFDKSTGEFIDGNSYCDTCLNECWECQLEIGSDDDNDLCRDCLSDHLESEKGDIDYAAMKEGW